MMALLEKLTNAQVQQLTYYQQRRDGDREARFKIHRTIPKITAENPMTLIDEFDDFETKITQTSPPSAKDWAITLDDALEGRAKGHRPRL